MKDIIELLKEKNIVMPIQEPLNNRYEKTCTYEDFVMMIENVVRNTMPNINFLPSEEKAKLLEPDRQMDAPLITFKTYHRKPLKESKPIFRHEVIEKSTPGEERMGTLYGWRMEQIIQFDIFTGTYKVAQETMNNFENQMLNYLSYFKKNGLIECLFLEQIEDETLNAFRDKCSVRSLRYKITLEKYWIDFESVLESFSTTPKLENN